MHSPCRLSFQKFAPEACELSSAQHARNVPPIPHPTQKRDCENRPRPLGHSASARTATSCSAHVRLCSSPPGCLSPACPHAEGEIQRRFSASPISLSDSSCCASSIPLVPYLRSSIRHPRLRKRGGAPKKFESLTWALLPASCDCLQLNEITLNRMQTQLSAFRSIN